jgi:hypothetical protein
VENTRELKRRQLIYNLRVSDRLSNELVGLLVDITKKGVMLLSEGPISTGKDFHLKLNLPTDMEGQKEIPFEAKSVWCQKDIDPDMYATGFQLIDLPEGDIATIERLIQDFASRG